jgi:hypothetical protein
MLAGAVVVLLGAAYYFFLRPPPPEQQETAAKPPSIEEPVQPPEEIDLLDLDLNESDSVVRKLVEGLSSRPELARWLVTDDLVRKFVAAVDNIALGLSPRAQVDFFKPDGSFLAAKTEDGRYIEDPAGFRRYDIVAEVFTSLDAKGFATLYLRMKPTITKAYRELGYPEADFDDTMRRAIAQMLAVPVVEGNIELQEEVVTFSMTDPDLEKLNPAQKHLLRMGPGNVQAIQAKLREIAGYLGL